MKPAGQRAEFLNRECDDDTALRARIDTLLAAHEQSRGALAESTIKATMKIRFAVQKIGRYKILEKIGEGG
jgi:hypothetical protein